MSMSAGSVFVRIAAQFDDRGFRKFEQDHVKAQRAQDISTRLSGDFDPKSFNLYEKRLDEVQTRVKRRDAFKATLGGDYNPAAFRAYERDLAKAERDTKQAHSRMSGAFSSSAAKVAGGFAAAGGVTALTVFAKNATGAASDIAESITKNQRLFGEYSKDIEKFSQTSAASFGISRKAALEYTGVFGNLFRAFGTSKEKSAGLSTELTKLAADMASFNNTSIEDALEALRSGLVGESEPLRKFGVNLNETALKAEALSSGLVKAAVDHGKLKIATESLDIAQQNVAKAVKEHGASSIEAQRANVALERAQQAVNKTAAGGKVELNAQQKALAAVALTTKQTAAAHGDFARTSTGLANQQRILKASISDTAAKIGEVLMPVALKAAMAFNKLIKEWKEGAGTGGELRDTLTAIGGALKSLGGFLKDHTGLVKTAAAAWIAYRSALIAAGAVSGGKALLGSLGVGAATTAAGSGAAATAAGAGGASLAARFAGPAGIALLAGTIAEKLTMTGPLSRVLGTTEENGARKRTSVAQDAAAYRSTGSLIGSTSGKNAVQVVKYESQRLAMAGDVDGIKRLRAAWVEYQAIFKHGGGESKDVMRALGAEFDRLGKKADALPGGIAANARSLKATMEGMAINFARNLDKSGDAIHDIRSMVGVNMKNLARDMDVHSEDGQAAVARNFKLAASSVKRAMKDATGYTFDASKTIADQMRGASAETRKYLAEIARMTEASLKASGFTDQQAHTLATQGSREADPQRMKRAGGGWIGARGMVGTDTVPTMLAPGEAVLNRHQQGPVNMALQSVFGMSLDDLFGRVQTPHYMAKGGIVPVPGFPGEMAASSVVPEIQAIAKRFHLTLTDAYGQGHKSPGHTRFGTAADFAGPDAAMDAAVKYLVAKGYVVGYDGRFGSAAWPGHGPSYVAGGNAHLHVELGSGGGSIEALVKAIKAPRTKMKGAIGAVVQGSLDLATKGANSMLRRVANASLTTPVAGGGTQKAPSGGGSTVGASVFGGPGDPGTGHIGYRGDDLNVFPNSFAELNMGTAMGNLPYLAALRVTGPRGSKVLRKRDIGAGGGNVQGKTRGIDLWYKAAEALGVNGLGLVKIQRLAKGGKVKGKLGGSQAAISPWKAPKGVPQIQVPRMSVEELEADETRLRGVYVKTRDELEGLPAQIKAADKKVQAVKDRAGPPSRKKSTPEQTRQDAVKVRKKRDDLKEAKATAAKLRDQKARDEKRIAEQRAAWKDAEKAATAGRKFQARVDHLTSVANTAATEMDNAAKRGDKTAWTAAKKRRDAAVRESLGLARAQQSQLKTKTGANADALAETIATLTGSFQDAAGEQFQVDTFTPDQTRIISGVDKAAALAALTDDGDKDDLAAAELRANYLRQFFNIAQANGASDSVITDLASQLKSAQDNVKSITDSVNTPSADQQAIIDRQQGIIELATKNAQANATALAVFSGSGDIGMGGGNAWQAVQPNITINTLHPGDPGTLAAIASAATSGMALQNGINSSKLTVG